MIRSADDPLPQEAGLDGLRGLPETQILVRGFSLSLTWELLQSPFYADTFRAPWDVIAYSRIHCALGDVMILLFSFWLAALVWGRSWMDGASRGPLAVFVSIGFVYTIFSEYFNVYGLQSWEYSAWMPQIKGIGLLPLLQWIVVPLFMVVMVRRSK